jgi:4-hydroxybenzoate polyprenyltransferase
MNSLTQAIKVARPIHWVKNLALFAALVFSGHLLDNHFVLVFRVVKAFIAFSLATSATYIFNDILDVKHDQLHPIKKERPIAAKRLSVGFAFLELSTLAVGALYIASEINSLFFFAVAGYLLLQFIYSVALKNFAIIDIIIIATGFIIRIYAGAFVINAHLSVWFLLCVISTALFLASGKRRAEINILESVGVTRKSLIKYKRELLNSYVTMFGNASWMSWALFTFFESPPATTPVWLFLAEISRTTAINKMLMLTIPLAIFGIMRYESLIFEGKSEAPEKLLLTDIPLYFYGLGS